MKENYWVVLLPITLAYVFVALFLGVRSSKGKIKDQIESWAVASRSTGVFVMFFLLGAGAISAYTFLGAPGWAYSTGVPVLYVTVYLTVGYFVAYFFISRIWKAGAKFHFVTQAELFRHRFESKGVGVIAALIGILACIGYGITQGMGCGFILNFASGGRIPFWLGVAIPFAAMCIYIIVSGLRAIGWTNVLQGILMAIMAVVAGIMVVNRWWGGTGNLFAAITAEAPKFLTIQGGGWNYRIWTTSIIVSALGIVCWPTTWIMWMGSKNVNNLKKACTRLPIYWFIILPTILIGYAAILKLPGITPTDRIAMEASLRTLPLGVTGLIFSATLAAAMSSCEILILNAGLQFAMDIVRPFKAINSQKAAKLSKIMVIPFALIIVLVSAFQPQSLVGMLLMTYGWLVQLFPTIFATFYWKRATKVGAFAGLLGGTIVSILMTKTIPNPTGIHAGIWGLAVNIILLVVLSLLTKPPKEEIVREYMGLPEVPVESLMNQ